MARAKAHGGPPKEPSAPGRRPDPDLERRVFETTLDVYAELGWGGFTIDAVARRGHIGKVSIYNRWPTKQALLAAALGSVFPDAEDTRKFTGTFREQMVDAATRLIERYLSRHGLAQIRAQLEAQLNPEVIGAALADERRRTAEASKELVSTAIERGELPEGTSTVLVLDGIIGALMHRILWMTPEQRGAMAAEPAKFAERVVDLVLDGARHQKPAAGSDDTADA